MDARAKGLWLAAFACDIGGARGTGHAAGRGRGAPRPRARQPPRRPAADQRPRRESATAATSCAATPARHSQANTSPMRL